MKLTSETKNFLFILFAIIIALLAIKIFDISYPLTITTTTRSSELSVVGEGKVEVAPDTAFVDAGITVNNVPSVEAAQKAIDEINNRVIVTLKNLNIKEEDIKTSNYSIYPNYSYEKEESKITGYNGNASVTIKVKQIKQVSTILIEVTKAGANQVNGARFTIDDPDKFREEARNKAIENAKEQAKKLAKALGIKLGKIVNIVESVPSFPAGLYAEKAVGGGRSAPVIEPGTQTITSTVTLYFEKK